MAIKAGHAQCPRANSSEKAFSMSFAAYTIVEIRRSAQGQGKEFIFIVGLPVYTGK